MSLVVEGFAGPGGFSEGLHRAGFTDVVGVDIDEWACATAVAAGHRRVRADVSTFPLRDLALVTSGVVMSPPCPPWSQSGQRLGPRDRADVLRRIDAFAAGVSPEAVDWNDPRSPLCAEPMRWVVGLSPQWVVLEQVPGALALWRHIARHLEDRGYSVATGVLHCEEYGVPQTRKRAVLVAQRDGTAVLPAPTHQRFGRPSSLPRWVSMMDAIGWGLEDRPAWTVTGGGTRTGGAEVFGNAKCRALLGGRRPTPEEAAVLQTFPDDYPWQGTKTQRHQQIGDAVPPALAASIFRSLVQSQASREAA